MNEAASPRLSVVVPVFDEQDSLAPLHRELDAALSGVPGGVEFVLVDDGSRDRSLEVMRELARDPGIRAPRLLAEGRLSAEGDAPGDHSPRPVIASSTPAEISAPGSVDSVLRSNQ